MMLPVAFFHEMPLTDLLPVIKTRHFIGDFKPLMYLKLAAVKDRGLIVDLMKFERDPAVAAGHPSGGVAVADSCVAVSFSFSAGNDAAAYLFNAEEGMELRRGASAHPAAVEKPESLFSYRGADEQGWYWGVRFTVPLQQIETMFPGVRFAPGQPFFCNAFSFLNEGQRPHFGSVAPVQSKDLLDARNLSAFLIADESDFAPSA